MGMFTTRGTSWPKMGSLALCSQHQMGVKGSRWFVCLTTLCHKLQAISADPKKCPNQIDFAWHSHVICPNWFFAEGPISAASEDMAHATGTRRQHVRRAVSTTRCSREPRQKCGAKTSVKKNRVPAAAPAAPGPWACPKWGIPKSKVIYIIYPMGNPRTKWRFEWENHLQMWEISETIPL